MDSWQERAKKAEAELNKITRMIKAEGRFIESAAKSVEDMLDRLDYMTRSW